MYTQLPMFMSGKEIWDNIFAGSWVTADHYGQYPPEEVYDMKLRATRHLRSSVAEHGVKRPIVLMSDYIEGFVTIGNGHHRSVLANELDLIVPVVWTTDDVHAVDYLGHDDSWTW